MRHYIKFQTNGTKMEPFSCARPWIERHVSHVTTHLDRRTFIKSVRDLTVTVSEVNQYTTFSVLFFPITVIWRETHHSGCVNGLPLPSTFLCVNSSDWMTWSLNAACRQVDSFNQTLYNTFFLPSSKIPDHILELKHLLSCLFFSHCFHSLINKIFISCLHSNLFKPVQKQLQLKPKLPGTDTFDCNLMDTKEIPSSPPHTHTS